MTAIPFLPRFHEAIMIGVKTMTCRTKKYGEAGDIVHTNIRGVRIQLVDVRRVRLGDVADNNFIDEGCESRTEFVQVWETIHPGRGFDPEQKVWLHVFRVARVNDDCAHPSRELVVAETNLDGEIVRTEERCDDCGYVVKWRKGGEVARSANIHIQERNNNSAHGVREVTTAMAQAKITMEELRAKSAKAEKSATTFEKSPTVDVKMGMEIVFRVKKVVSGKFKDTKNRPIDLVIASDVRVVENGGLVSRPLAGYTQEGLQGPRIATTIVAGADVRIPNFVVTRFSEQGIVFHPGYVYGSKYVDDKKTPAGTMKRASAYSLGTEYPDA